MLFLTRRGRYLGPLFEALYRRTGWGWTEGRVAHFISDVEAIFLQLARSDMARLRNLVVLGVACYAVMALEVWLVFWAIGLPVSVWSSMFVETFTRSASMFAGAIPANLGAMEASNVVGRARAGTRRRGVAGPRAAGARAVLGRPRAGHLSARYPQHAPGARRASGRSARVVLKALVAAIQGWATSLGGPGLFVIAALDSSFLSFPQVNDLLIIVLSTKSPQLMPYYAAMTTAGSLLGCFVLYGFARRGGDVFLRKRFSGPRVERGLALYQRHGLLAVIVPSLLPPPMPFKLFVLLAGAAKVSPWKFAAAIGVGPRHPLLRPGLSRRAVW